MFSRLVVNTGSSFEPREGDLSFSRGLEKVDAEHQRNGIHEVHERSTDDNIDNAVRIEVVVSPDVRGDGSEKPCDTDYQPSRQK